MSKEIDISAIKKGDTVLVEHVVTSVHGDHIEVRNLDAKSFYLPLTKIKQHTPKAFDWGEVKQMDAFVGHDEQIYYYIAQDPTSGGHVIVTAFDEVIATGDIMVVKKIFLDRAPEHDVKGKNHED